MNAESETGKTAGWDKRAMRAPAHQRAILNVVGRRGLPAAGPTLPSLYSNELFDRGSDRTRR